MIRMKRDARSRKNFAVGRRWSDALDERNGLEKEGGAMFGAICAET